MKKLSSIVLSLNLIIFNSFLSLGGVQLNANSNQKVDIVLSSAIDDIMESNIDINDISYRIDKELNNYGDIKYVLAKSSEMKNTDLNFSDVVNSWKKIGSRVWFSDGNNIRIKIDKQLAAADVGCGVYDIPDTYRWKESYGRCSFWGSGLIDDTAFNTNNFIMQFSLNSLGTMHNGILFNITQNEDGSLNGYMFNLVMHLDNADYCLWKIKNYQLDTAFTTGMNSKIWCNNDRGLHLWEKGYSATYNNMEAKCIYNWPIQKYNNVQYTVTYNKGHLKIETDKSGILIDKDLKELDFGVFLKGAYGFYGINCEQTSSMVINNFSIKKEESIDLTEVLNNCDFRVNTIKNFINIDSKTINIIDQPNLIAKLTNNDINYLHWMSKINKDYVNTFLNILDKGMATYFKKEDMEF